MKAIDPQFGSTLAQSFINTAHKHWHRRCIADFTGRKFTFGQTLTAATALAVELDNATGPCQYIAIMLPPSTGSAIINIAITLLGKVTVNLNYTLSAETIQQSLDQCGRIPIVTSRKFLEKFENLKTLSSFIFIEDVAKNIKKSDKIKAYTKAHFAKLLFPAAAVHSDTLATIIFTSGSSGQPKGVMLSHKNILSNIQALLKTFYLESSDCLCGILPFFHSFGFTCTLWLPLLAGVPAAYIPNPLDAGTVGKVSNKNKCSVIFATPAFLSTYTRKVSHQDFAHLRAAVVGAEKLKKPIADAFEEKFKIRPIEGYGATELSPVVSLNLPESLSTESFKLGYKENTVGKPVPGIEAKIVSVDDHQPLPPNERGLLMIKGPNVMLGYLNDVAKTSWAIHNGWYNTGDIATIDEDGFITITDRLSRFSKIAGEMVPHISLEQIYNNAIDNGQQTVAVTSIPHPTKGEQLIVLHSPEAPEPEKLHEIVANSNIPNLWKPARKNYVKIESIPTLAAGKVDVRKLREIAMSAKNDS